MKEKMKQGLIDAAAEAKVLTYGQLAEITGTTSSEGAYPRYFFQTLTDIGYEEYRKKRPPLNVLVVSRNTGLPASGFYIWYKKKVDPKFDVFALPARKELFNQLSQKAFDYWA
jgi:hypothetical protein